MKYFPYGALTALMTLMALKAARIQSKQMPAPRPSTSKARAPKTSNLSLPSRLLRSLSIILLLGVQLGCTATPLPPYEATYTTKLRGVKITGTRKFENTGNNSYKVSWKAKALWMRLNEWSEFELVDGKQIRPISYHYTRKGLGTDKPIHIIFDWENNLINASKGDKEYQFALEPNTLDRLSYQVQMQIDLLISPDIKALNYTVANHDKLSQYAFSYEKQEVIKTELGDTLSRIFKREKKDKTTRIWLSADQYFVPVKIEQTEDNQSSVIAIKNWKSEAENTRGLLSFSAPSHHQNRKLNELEKIEKMENIANIENVNSHLTTAKNLLSDSTTKKEVATPSAADNTDFDGDF